MAPQKKLKGVKLAKGLEYNGSFPKGASFVYGEVKKDGLRGFAIKKDGKVKLYTASGVRVVNAPQVERALTKLSKKHTDNRFFDGEFFYKNCRTTLSIVKKQTPDHPLRDRLTFHLFDTLTLAEWNNKECTTQLKRRKVDLTLMFTVFEAKHKKKPYYKNLQQFQHHIIAPTDKAVQKFHANAVKDGHEGMMIKDPESLYSFRKNRDWQKLKPYRESDLKIVDVKKGNGKHKDRLGSLRLKGVIDDKKVLTWCGGGLTDEQRTLMWKMHKQGNLIGKIVEMQHEGLTVNKALRFPCFLRFHPAKNL